MLRPKAGICPFVSESVSSKLIQGNYTVADIISVSLETISSKCSVPIKDLVIIRQQLIANCCAPIVNANETYEEMLANLGAFTTGIEKLDFILDGGIMCGEIIEIFGSSGTGKTQMCFHITAHVVSTTKKCALFIDTCGGFSSTRINQILQESGLNENTCLDSLHRITYQSSYDIYDLICILDKIIDENEKGDQQTRSTQLIIIDSIASVLIPFVGSSDGTSLMNRISNKLKMLSSVYYKTILMTNEQVQWGDEDAKPALGQYWGSVPHIRLMLKLNIENQDKDDLKRQIKIYKSTRSESERSVEVKLSTKGIEG